jgi:hypothetical protein
MVDEVFALSPISARAVQPSEADYDAIKEAFMETSRGRWFLGEYAKRNRNADTKMVLDAVARIEDTIAAQKTPVRDPLLDEALASLRAVLAEARKAAEAAVGDLALEQNLAPVRKGARVIREIAWRLREIGADGRICDLIDSQVEAIEGAAGRLSPADLATALSGAFDRIEGKIAAFDNECAVPSPAAAAEAAPSQDLSRDLGEAPEAAAEAEAPSAEMQVEEPAETSETMHASLVQVSSVAPETETALKIKTETEVNAVAVEPAVAAEPAVASETAGGPADVFDASDEAMLDMIALEMAAPDTDAAYEPSLEELTAQGLQFQEASVNEPANDAPQAGGTLASAPAWEIDVTFESEAGESRAAKAAEPEAAAASPAVAPLQVAPEPEPQPVAEALPAPSLGASLLASGIVSRPRTKPDALAPIRRMSQNEKIAFFS